MVTFLIQQQNGINIWALHRALLYLVIKEEHGDVVQFFREHGSKSSERLEGLEK